MCSLTVSYVSSQDAISFNRSLFAGPLEFPQENYPIPYNLHWRKEVSRFYFFSQFFDLISMHCKIEMQFYCNAQIQLKIGGKILLWTSFFSILKINGDHIKGCHEKFTIFFFFNLLKFIKNLINFSNKFNTFLRSTTSHAISKKKVACILNLQHILCHCTVD